MLLKKTLVGLVMVAFLLGGGISYAHAQGLSLSELVDLLISAGIATP